jgi:thiol-disulfide isomerase/thioredoxin
MKASRAIALAMLAAAAAALFLGARSPSVGGPSDLFNLQAGYVKTGLNTSLLSFEGATGYLNGRPPSAEELRGKVVLVDFWTYSCINWRRTLPYLRAWNEKYKDRGLVIVGVHTPEFGFEKDIANVGVAVKDMRIEYPVVLDSDYRIWQRFNNEYWPALYLVDPNGRVRYFHPGEGEYQATERAIQQLLAEAGAARVSHELAFVQAGGVEADADVSQLRTPESYVGYGRGERLAGGFAARDMPHAYAAPGKLALNSWALSGDWTVGREYATSNQAGGAIAFEFRARDVHLVMGPSQAATPIRFRVRIDGRKPGADHGVDVDANGEGTLAEPKMYNLVRGRGRIEDRRIDIEFLDAGARAYVFTFG